MRLSRCILTLATCMGLTIGLSLGTARLAKASCGDGVTTPGEACDAGTPVCQGGKNAGTECHKATDCSSLVCGCTGGSCNNLVGNRDDVANACRSNCMLPMCGDGVSDTGEQCDAGSSTSTTGPCLGSAPNTVCAVGAVVVTGSHGQVIHCANDGQCVLFGAKCTGNPQCHLAQCGDGFVCSDPACTSGSDSLVSSTPGFPGPEACDDGNTSNTDGCTSFGFAAIIAAGSPAQTAVPDQCQLNVCGDGVTNSGVEQCDGGAALCLTGARTGKPCCTAADCLVGNIAGICSSTVAPASENSNNPNSPCRCNTCEVPFCGDGISDNTEGEQCDDGTTSNGPGKFCNKERRCIGGENGCDPASVIAGHCSSDTNNASRLAAHLCASGADCTKGTCGVTACEQNSCGDGILAGNEMCDDGNLIPASGSTDTCGAAGSLTNTTTLCGQVALALHCNTTALENNPGACPPCGCILPFCGDGITGPGEMCDAGTAICNPGTTFNGGSPCHKQSDCKVLPGTVVNPPGPTDNICVPSGLPALGQGNRDDTPNRCRSNCMPPSCGDGVSDSGEQCEPPAAGTFCRKNALGQCVLNTCGDDDVCNKTATDSTGAIRTCTSGPNGGVEQCDDSNTVNPNSTNTDTCFNTCSAAACGDGVTEVGEQCDSFGPGCSNGDELQDGIPLQCCIDGEIVDASHQIAAGLISAETGFIALRCSLPNAIGAAACDARLQKALQHVQDRVSAASVYTAQDDLSRATRIMRSARVRVDRLFPRLARVARPGGACAAAATRLSNELSDIRDMVQGISGHLNDEVGGP